MDRSRFWGIIGIGVCLLLGACGPSQATGGGVAATGTVTQAPPTFTTAAPTATAPAIATRPAAATSTTGTATRPAAAATPATGVPFYVIYDSGRCGLGRLDTSNGTYARQITASGPVQTISLTLSDQELATIRQKVEAIRFFDYPERFSVTPAPGSPVAVQVPMIAYTVTVQIDGRAKTVTWSDTIGGATTPEAERLRELGRLIEGIVMAHPEYQQMPKPEFGCL